MERFYQNRVMLRISSALVGLLLGVYANTAASQTEELQPFTAKYAAFQYDKELGTATISLDALGRNKYRLSYQSKISMFFLSDKRKEVSLFSYVDEKIVPFKYTYERTGFGSDKELVAEFDTNNKTITLDRETTIPWNGELDNQLYRFDVQIQLARKKSELSYSLINNRGKPRHYDMLVVGTEVLDMPYGKVEAIKVKMIRSNSSRETYAWFAPKLNYVLVRLQQYKEGEEQGDIQLVEYTGPTLATQ